MGEKSCETCADPLCPFKYEHEWPGVCDDYKPRAEVEKR